MSLITKITDTEEKITDSIADRIPFLPKIPQAAPTSDDSTSPNTLNIHDIISPLEIEVDFNQIRIDHRLFRSFFVSTYPRYIEPNWLEPLVDFDHSLDIAMFIYPTNSKTVLDDLRHKIAEMEATIQTDIENNRPVNPSVQVALDDAQSLQEQLAKGAERFFNFGLYVTVPAETKEDLNNTSKMVESTLGSISITARAMSLQMEDAFTSTMPLGQDLLKLNHNMDTTSLATTFPFTTSELTANEGLIYGINEHNGSLIVFDRYTLENANMVVFAKSGSGKSISRWDKTLVMTENGQVSLEEIGSLIEEQISLHGATKIEDDIEGVINPKLKVLTFDKDLKATWANVTVAARKKFSPRNHLYTITTKSGRQITVTADHNLAILRNGKIRVMRSEAIKCGEALPIPRYIPSPTYKKEVLDLKTLVPNWPSNLPQQLSLDQNLLTLLGLITSEGCITQEFTKIYNIDSEVNKITEKCSLAIGAKTWIIKKYLIKKGIECGRAITPNHYSHLFIELGVGGKSGDKHIPPLLFSLSKEQIAHYLRAYFEGDGGVESHSVCVTTKSSQLASDLTYLLLRFGIIARISNKEKYASNTINKTKRTYYQITISGYNQILKFKNSIGFLTATKNSQLQRLLDKVTFGNTNIDLIPTLQPIFNSLYKTLFQSSEIPNPQYIIDLKNEQFTPSREMLLRYIESCEQRITELKSLHGSIQLLNSLPSLAQIIQLGVKNRVNNHKLWQALGQSWRIMKSSLYSTYTRNALLAYQTTSGTIITNQQLNKAIYTSFKQQGISLRSYDRSLWTSIVDRKTGNSEFKRVWRASKFIAKKYRSTQLKIRHAEIKLAQLKTFANSDLFWDPIVKIERIKHREKFVYDLQVDNGVFVAGTGGLFVHNSYLVKLEALRSLMFGTQIIIIDPEQEYKRLAESVGGEYISFSSGSPVKINPFDLSDIATPGENELGRKALSLTGFLKLVLGELDPSQAAILDRAIISTYRLKGITQEPETQTKEAPLMEDLYKVLIGMEDPRAQEISFRLERFIKGSLAGIFSAPSNLNLNNQLIVFSIRELADQLRPLAMYLILDYIWTKVRTSTKKRMLIVDEAWYMMKNPDSAAFLVEMCKRARKYYLGVTTITQDVEDFLATDRGKEIITNSSIQVLLKQSPAAVDGVAKVFNLSEGEKRLLLSSGVGQGLFFAGPSHVAMRVISSEDEHQLITTNPAELLKQAV